MIYKDKLYDLFVAKCTGCWFEIHAVGDTKKLGALMKQLGWSYNKSTNQAWCPNHEELP